MVEEWFILNKRQKKEPRICEALGLIWQRPTFPLGVAVSSAMQGLTSLFGMVRGVHLLYNHQKYLLISFDIFSYIQESSTREVFGLLVLLGFDITAFTPATYQGRNLQPPY